jgi:hypothetical protein
MCVADPSYCPAANLGHFVIDVKGMMLKSILECLNITTVFKEIDLFKKTTRVCSSSLLEIS